MLILEHRIKYPVRGFPYKVDTDIHNYIQHLICKKLKKVLTNHKIDLAIDKPPFANVVRNKKGKKRSKSKKRK